MDTPRSPKTVRNTARSRDGSGSKKNHKKPRRPEVGTPHIERSWLPDYDRMIMEVLHKVGLGWVAVWDALFKLHWLHFVLFPVGIYNLLCAWVQGFTGIPNIVERNSTATWFDRYVKLVVYPNADAPDTEKRGQYWVPQTDLATSAKHGLSQRGLKRWDMMRMIMLFFPQLMFGSLFRCLQYKFGFGEWKPSKGDNHQTYLAIVNTSLSTYYDRSVGAFVYHDIILLADYNRCQRKFNKIIVYADHNEGEVTQMVLVTAGDPIYHLESVETVITDPDEISILIVQIGAVHTHPHVHWWANGVHEVEQWKLRETSARWVNFLNLMAAFQSLFFYHAPFNNDTELLTRNAAGGIPVHADLPAELLEWSVMHEMIKEARWRLKDHFEQSRQPIKEQELNCLMSATIMHASDHHYLNKYTARNGISKVLKTDFRAMRVGIVAGYRWIGTKFLCKQYLDDPVCKILYEVALKHDPEFAEGILTVGCSI